MTLQSLKTACLMAGVVTPMIFTLFAQAADDVPQAQQDSARLMAKGANWSLRLPRDDKVVYKGVVSFDGVGTGDISRLYPAPNAIGFLAAVITHGAITESAKNSQKNRLQETADKVLAPYRPVLSNYTHRELMQRGLEKTVSGGAKKLVEFSEKPGADWWVESTPIFLMTQDQSAIILDNLISIYAPATPETPVYQNVVRVVSRPQDAADAAGLWIANEGAKLKDESANLLAVSLDTALNEAVRGPVQDNNPQKTFRYLEGKTEKMERATLVSEACERALIKTLRGTLMSIPVRRDAERCDDKPGSPK